ncbi:MAG: HK97 gp10 family phage protein [Eubacteriales bacterium]|nr:HK97 gp10 family phage protein [Eubacteriales bacterium]
MARMFSSGIDDVIAALDIEQEAIDRNGDAALNAGADVAVAYMQAEAPVRTGGLRAHIAKDIIKVDARGDKYINIYPTGFDPHGERYETIGSVLEYGRSDMQPNPWMSRAVKKANSAVLDAMVTELQKE